MTFWRAMLVALARGGHFAAFIIGFDAISFGLYLLGSRSGLSFGVGAVIAVLVPATVYGAYVRERIWRWYNRRRGYDLGPVDAMSVLGATVPSVGSTILAVWLLEGSHMPPGFVAEVDKALFLFSATVGLIIMPIVDDLIPGPRLFRLGRRYG